MVDPLLVTSGIQVANIVDRHLLQNERSNRESRLEDQRFDHQLQIEALRTIVQEKRDQQRQAFDVMVKEADQRFQADVVQWKARFDESILLKKQEFDRKEGKKNRKFQREMIEKKIAADEKLQKFLNRSNQEFQAKLEAIRRDTQLTIIEYTKQVDMAIAEDNRAFQAWLFEEQQKLQKELAEYQRETHLQVVKQQREATLEKINSEIALREGWPLTLQPPEILGSYPKNKPAPLRVIIIPPEIDYDQSGQIKQHSPNHEKRLAQGLRDFVQKYYPLHGETPVEFLGGAWKSNKFRQEAAIRRIFHHLPSEPMLVLDSEVDDEFFNLRIAYWSGGQETYHYQSIISNMPYRQHLHRWASERTGEQSEKMNYAPEDYGKFSQFMIACQCLLVGFFTDFHYQMFHAMLPKSSTYLSEIYKIFPDAETREVMFSHFVSSYEEVFSILAVERDYFIPDFRLHLAQNLSTLPDKSWAEKQFIASLRSWLALRTLNVSQSEVMRDLLNTIFELANSLEDNEFLFKLKTVLQQIQAV